jgi:hypothetical protein
MQGGEKAREVEEDWARWGMVVRSPSCLRLLVLEQARVGLRRLEKRCAAWQCGWIVTGLPP